ncbi:MAG: WD40/YVTN/BNR-like repeat-containing protein [Gammaproteobacteria bacterium]
MLARRSRRLWQSGRRGFAAVAVAWALAGCEAPLVLDGVERMRANPVQRTDRYQAAASTGKEVVVVGNQGVILRSEDGGANWQRQVLPGWPALIDIAACPDGSLVALAYEKAVHLSVDGGRSWAAKPINDTAETPQSVTCAPDGRIWVVGSYTYIWSSADQGESWDESTRDEDALLTTVQFFTAEHGIVTGEFGTVLETTDGGANWESREPLPEEFYPQEAWFDDAANGWVIGLGGTILHTTDGGSSWTSQPTGTQVSLFGIERLGDTLYVVGGEGTLLAYRDGRWQAVPHGKPVRLYLRAILGVDPAHLLVGGIGGALHVIDVDGA